MAVDKIEKRTEYLFDDTWYFPATAITANSVADLTRDVTRQGYKAVGFIPMTTQNANVVWLGFKDLNTTGANTAAATVKNTASSQQTATVRFTVIYKKD